MLMATPQNALIFLGLVALSNCVEAKPYFYYFQEAPAPTEKVESKAQQAVKEVVDQVKTQAQSTVDQVQQQQQQQQQQQLQEQLPKRIQGHLNQLYSHGSSAVKSVVDTVQPDISNIGKDLSDVFQVTRENVKGRIEPLAQTVKPYIDHAHKVMAPYVSQAKEEVPKLINQAGPALSKVGEQVRGGISGVWGKITAAQKSGAAQIASAVSTVAPAASVGSGQQTVEKVQTSMTNAIQQPAQQLADAANQASQQATQQAQQQTQQAAAAIASA